MGRPAAAHRGAARGGPPSPLPRRARPTSSRSTRGDTGRIGAGGSLRYAVEHPPWRVYPEAAALVDLDFGRVYGAEWGVLTGRAPEHVALAEGSAVAVFRGERLRGGQPT